VAPERGSEDTGEGGFSIGANSIGVDAKIIACNEYKRRIIYTLKH